MTTETDDPTETSDDCNLTQESEVSDHPVRNRYRIEELLASSSPDAFQGEVDWGIPQGKEVW